MRIEAWSRFSVAWLIFVSAWAADVRAALPTPDADNGGISLPPGFRALVVADGLGPIRFISVTPNGDIYIKRTQRGLMALRDSTGSGRMDVVRPFGMQFGSGTGICVRDGWLYFSTDDAVYRCELRPGELVPSGPVQRIVTGLPPGQHEHEAKAFAFDDSGNLYVEVGCPSNASGDPDRAPGAVGVDPASMFVQHGGFWRFDANKPEQDQLRDGYRFSGGMRHAVSVAWNPVSKALFVTLMGRDQLNTVDSADYTVEDNAEKPAEEFHILKEGSNFGWPYTYWDSQQNARMLAPEFGGDNKKRDTSGKYPAPLVALPAHWAFLQMVYYDGTQFPAKYRGGMFLASHGSWNRAPLPQAGYKVVLVRFNEHGMPTGSFEIFADNFAGVPEVRSPEDAHYRPCGLATGPDGSLYVSDSEKGRVWRIIYTGEGASAAVQKTPQPGAAAKTNAAPVSPEAELYGFYCAPCHMADGNGVANLQPALRGNQVVTGDTTQLIRVVLEGPENVLPATRKHYSNKMPALDVLDDKEIASILTYVRRAFGGNTSSVETKEVATIRHQVEEEAKARKRK